MNFQTRIGSKTKGRGSQFCNLTSACSKTHKVKRKTRQQLIKPSERIKWIQKLKETNRDFSGQIKYFISNFSDRVKSSVFKVRGNGS